MTKLHHKRALMFATIHFSFSFVIGLVWLLCLMGAGLSDAYHEDPVWFKLLIGGLWVLQTPAAIVETAAEHSSPSGASFLSLIISGIIWSLILGYTFDWIKRKSQPPHD